MPEGEQIQQLWNLIQCATPYALAGLGLAYGFRKELQNRKLRQEIIIDPLTKLYSRRFFENKLPKILSDGERHGHSTSLLMVDIDYFKKFNDMHGHKTGDLILQVAADLIMNSSRESDYACRYGGEEIAVLLPETDLKEALKAAQRIINNTHEQLSAHSHYLLNGGKIYIPDNITFSIGVATNLSTWSKIDHNYIRQLAESLIKQSDQRLYQAKNKGRDRIVF